MNFKPKSWSQLSYTLGRICLGDLVNVLNIPAFGGIVFLKDWGSDQNLLT